MTKIKTLLIEDSGLMRILITDALRSDPDIEIIGTANNGKEGVEKASKLEPDVVVTDVLMPKYNGLYAVKNIMKSRPIPIILLSSLGKTTPEIFDALSAGAFDFIDKPHTKDSSSFKSELFVLRERIKIAAGVEVLQPKDGAANTRVHTFSDQLNYHVIAIGTSTGGPTAVETIIKKLPENLAVPVVIVQHMPNRFIPSFAARLNALIPLHVKVAEKNEKLVPQTIYIAPASANFAVFRSSSGSVQFTTSDKHYPEYNHPSVDCMFESIAEAYGAKALGIILTGMGKDGSLGLLKIKKNGGLTVAQDARSSVVNGMPQAAVDHGAVDHVVPLKEISGFVISSF